MELIISPFWSLLDLLSTNLFLSGFLPRKTNKKVFFLSFTIAWLLPAIYTWTGFSTLYGQIISIAALLALCIINYDGSVLRKILFLVVTYTSLYLIDSVVLFGTSVIIGIPLADLVWKKWLYTLIGTTGKLIALLIGWTFYRIRVARKTSTLPGKWLLLTLLFPVVSLIVLLMLFSNFELQEDLSVMHVVVCTFLALANVAIIYLIQIM